MEASTQVMESVIEYRRQEYAALEAAVFEALEAGASPVVLDLDRIETLDTAALRVLISLLRRARSAGGELALRVSRPDLLRTLSVTALDRVLPILHAEVL